MSTETFTDGKFTFTRPIRTPKPPTSEGVDGLCGPNSMGYAIHMNCHTAMQLRKSLGMAAYGYMPEPNRDILEKSALADALRKLGKFDKRYCHYANWDHCPEMFDPTTV